MYKVKKPSTLVGGFFYYLKRSVSMVYRDYKNPSNVGFKGWGENAQGTAIGFVRLNGEIAFSW